MTAGMQGIFHIAILTLQACLLASCVWLFFRLRLRFGLSFFVVALVLLNDIEGSARVVDLLPQNAQWMQHFGGSLLFSVKLFALLLIYLREDAIEARAVVYGMAASAFVVLLMVATQTAHLWVAGVDVSLLTNAIKEASFHFFGMAILILDAVVMILVYEWTSQRVRGVFFPVLVAFLAALSLDNAIFYALFIGQDEFHSVLILSFAGKWYAAITYASIFSFAHRYSGLDADTRAFRRVGDVYETLSFRQRFEALRRTADVDALTSLFTRARLESDAQDVLDKPDRWLWILDLDHFKRINDRYGHLRGDAVLQATARCILDCLPKDARAYRYGGEELVILGRFGIDQAEQLRKAIADRFAQSELATVSIGGAHAGEGAKLRALFALADRRLYRAKAAGRNCLVHSD